MARGDVTIRDPSATRYHLQAQWDTEHAAVRSNGQDDEIPVPCVYSSGAALPFMTSSWLIINLAERRRSTDPTAHDLRI